jgi:ABC-type sulfate transport system permease component
VILEQLMLGIVVLAVVLLLLLPFVLVMAGVGAAMLLWVVASAAVLGALVFCLAFPGAYGLAVLLLALVVGLLLVDRRSRHGAS